MSHFVVMVFGDNAEEMLAPYGEDIRNCPRESIKFGVELSSYEASERFKEYLQENTEPSAYEDADEYMRDYYEYDKDENGNYGYYYNPDTEWDW